MGARVTRDPLQPPGRVHQSPCPGLAVVDRLQFLRFQQRRIQGYPRPGGDQLGQLVDLGQGDVESPTNIADGSAGRHRPVGDDLSDAVGPVASVDVVDDSSAALDIEVDVDIRHGHPLGIEEPLEDQAVLKRIDVRDPQAVGDQAAGGGAAAGADLDALLPSGPGEVPHDQEVGCEAGRPDHAQLVREPLQVLRRRVLAAPPLAQPFGRHQLQEAVSVLASGHVVERQQPLVQQGLEATAGGDLPAVVDGFQAVVELGRHLRSRADIEVGPREAQPLGFVQPAAGLDAEQDVVGLGVVLVHVVAVVGGYQWKVGLTGDLDQPLPDHPLLLHPVVLDLQEIPIGAEYLRVLPSDREGPVGIARQQSLGHLAADAAGQADQPARMLGQELVVDARLVVETLQVGLAYQLDQVAIALSVPGQQDQVEGVAVGPPLLLQVGTSRHIDLAPDDRRDPYFGGGLIELDSPGQDTVVGEGDRVLAEVVGPLGQTLDPGRSVEQGVFGVGVEVRELDGRHSCARVPELGESPPPEGFSIGDWAGPPWSGPAEQSDRLKVVGLGKHVDEPEPVQPVGSATAEGVEVACQRRDLAAEVNDRWRPGQDQPAPHLRQEAGPRGVQDHHPGRVSAAELALDRPTNGADSTGGVHLGMKLAQPGRDGVRLDHRHPGPEIGQSKAEDARPAVGVDHVRTRDLGL